MIMKVVYNDGSWFVGNRGLKEIGLLNHETKGTHHFTVIDGDEHFKEICGKEIAVPVNSVRYFILNFGRIK